MISCTKAALGSAFRVLSQIILANNGAFLGVEVDTLFIVSLLNAWHCSCRTISLDAHSSFTRDESKGVVWL